MKFVIIILTTIISLAIDYQAAYSTSAIDLYNLFIQGYPSVQSYTLKNQALSFENENFNRKRFLNPSVTTFYSDFQTRLSGNYSISAVSITNNIDFFNKIGIDKDRNKLEINQNNLLLKSERKDIFSRILNAYANAIKNKYLIKIHSENLAWIEENISLIKNEIENGKYPETELVRWKIERLNLINQIEIDRLEILKAEETLKLHSKLEKILTNDIDISKFKNIDFSEISESDFINNSPELETYNINKKQLELDIKSEIKNFFPDLQVSNSFVLNNDPTSNGNQNIALASLNFILPNGSERKKIKSAQSKIQSLEYDKENLIILLKNDFRSKVMEINAQKNILYNLELAVTISQKNLDKLLMVKQNKVIDYQNLLTTRKDLQLIQESFVNTLVSLDQNYEYLYHLSKGDIY